MAVGISCAGSGMREAVALLDPLLTDATDFVRQGALIATALVLIQQPEPQVIARQSSLHLAGSLLIVAAVAAADDGHMSDRTD